MPIRDELADVVRRAFDEIGENDPEALRATCAELSEVAIAARGVSLPVPVSAVHEPWFAALVDFALAGTTCEAGAILVSEDSLNEALDHIQSGIQHLSDTTDAIDEFNETRR